MVDVATVHISGLDLQSLHTASSTNTVATKDLVDIAPIGEGVGSSGELQQVMVKSNNIVHLVPSRRNE
jgi:hypothetical protein